MRRKQLAVVVCGLSVLLAAAAADGRAAFEQRRDTMKAMGHALYLGVGRVAKGRAEFGADTVASAEMLAKLAATIGSLFPPGSDVPDSNMKPAILSAPEQVAQLAGAVQAATPGFVVEVKSGDKARIAAAAAAMNKACDACHNEFRKEE
ncbi:MAG TPA: cytochrome c [Acetobacteraceae bacterium]